MKTWLMDAPKVLIMNTQGGWSEEPTERSVECPCVQEPGDEDPESRHGEGPVGSCDEVGDPRLSDFVRSLPFLFLDWKGVRFLDEEICCYATRFSSAGLYLASSGLVLRNQCQTIFSPSRIPRASDDPSCQGLSDLDWLVSFPHVCEAGRKQRTGTTECRSIPGAHQSAMASSAGIVGSGAVPSSPFLPQDAAFLEETSQTLRKSGTP